MADVQIVLTSGTSWTVPADFDPNANRVECIEGGVAGNKGVTGPNKTTAGSGGRSGSGGRFQGINNFQVAPGATCTIAIGAATTPSLGNTTITANPTWISRTGVKPTLTADGCVASTSSPVGDYGFNGQAGLAGGAPSGTTRGVGRAGGGAGGNAGAGSGQTPGTMSPAWTGGYGPGTGGTAGTGGNGGNGTVYGAGGGSGRGGAANSGVGDDGGTATSGIIVITYTPYVPSAGGISFRASIIG